MSLNTNNNTLVQDDDNIKNAQTQSPTKKTLQRLSNNLQPSYGSISKQLQEVEERKQHHQRALVSSSLMVGGASPDVNNKTILTSSDTSSSSQQPKQVVRPTAESSSLFDNNKTEGVFDLFLSSSNNNNEQDSVSDNNSILDNNTTSSENSDTEEQHQQETINNDNNRIINIMISDNISTIFTPCFNRCLNQKVLADKLSQYFLLSLLSQNGKYAFIGFIAIYLLFTILLWIPTYLLSKIITECGVYILIVTTIIYIGKCILRLLAFPGTNYKVYGEIEVEWNKYALKMLEGGIGSCIDFSMAVKSGCIGNSSNVSASAKKMNRILGKDDNNDGWDIVDVPSTYKRVEIYKKRVFGVYYEVLHCLLEENGQGYDPSGSSSNNGSAGGGRSSTTMRNGFYDRLGENISTCAMDTCKRINLCCERQTSNSTASVDVEAVQLNSVNNLNQSPSNSGMSSSDGRTFTSTSTATSSTTKYGNNILVGDIGNMGNLTNQARLDGRELYTLLGLLLNDLSLLESSASNILRGNTTPAQQLKKGMVSDETSELATKLIQRAEELREFVVSRMKQKDSSDGNDEDDENNGSTMQDNDDESDNDVGAEAVRHRLEEQGGTASSSSTMGMVKSAVEAFVSMIDPPPHKSIFGLDLIRGCFLARYHGARQFWVKRGHGGGRLDVIMIPSMSSSSSSGSGQQQQLDSSAESLLPLSPRKGREDIIMNTSKKRRAVLYCNPNAGLVEVATGMGLTGGNVDEGEDEEEKEP